MELHFPYILLLDGNHIVLFLLQILTLYIHREAILGIVTCIYDWPYMYGGCSVVIMCNSPFF
jgi:hypothetical protein